MDREPAAKARRQGAGSKVEDLGRWRPLTTSQRLGRWLRRTRGAVCDDCIARELELSGRRQANRAARGLANQANFYRDKGVCALCGTTRMVIESL